MKNCEKKTLRMAFGGQMNPSALEQRLNQRLGSGTLTMRGAGMLADIENQRRGDTTQRYGIDTNAGTARMNDATRRYGVDTQAGTQQYQSDNSLQGSMYQSDAPVRNAYTSQYLNKYGGSGAGVDQTMTRNMLSGNYQMPQQQQQPQQMDRFGRPQQQRRSFGLRNGGEIHALMGFGSEGYTDRYGTRWMSSRDGVEFENKQRAIELANAEKEQQLGMAGQARPGSRPGLRMQDGGGYGQEETKQPTSMFDYATATQGSPSTPDVRTPDIGALTTQPSSATTQNQPGRAMVDKDNPLGLRMGGTLQTSMGGDVPGTGHGDKIPAKYEPGEFVVSNDMLKADPSLLPHLRELRKAVLAQKGMTPEQADAKAIHMDSEGAGDERGAKDEQESKVVKKGFGIRADNGWASPVQIAYMPGVDEYTLADAKIRAKLIAEGDAIREVDARSATTESQRTSNSDTKFMPGTRAVLSGAGDDMRNAPSIASGVGGLVRATTTLPVSLADDILVRPSKAISQMVSKPSEDFARGVVGAPNRAEPQQQTSATNADSATPETGDGGARDRQRPVANIETTPTAPVLQGATGQNVGFGITRFNVPGQSPLFTNMTDAEGMRSNEALISRKPQSDQDRIAGDNLSNRFAQRADAEARMAQRQAELQAEYRQGQVDNRSFDHNARVNEIDAELKNLGNKIPSRDEAPAITARIAALQAAKIDAGKQFATGENAITTTGMTNESNFGIHAGDNASRERVAANQLGVTQQELGMKKESHEAQVQDRNELKNLEALYKAEEDPARRDAIEQQIRVMRGKDIQPRFKAHVLPTIKNADGSTTGGDVYTEDMRTGDVKFVSPGGGNARQDPAAVRKDAEAALKANPGAKAEINRRLIAAGHQPL